MKRRTPLKPGQPPRRKTPLRPMSAQKCRQIRETAAARRAYVASKLLCECCHRRKATDCHEIARGSFRHVAVHERLTWLALCGGPKGCHDKMDDYSVWPVARQMALKFLNSPEDFNPVTVNLVRDRDPDAVTWGDVARYITLKEQTA